MKCSSDTCPLALLQLLAKLRAGRNAGAGAVTKGKVTVKGSNASVQHTINEDERTEFTRHINSVSRHYTEIAVWTTC